MILKDMSSIQSTTVCVCECEGCGVGYIYTAVMMLHLPSPFTPPTPTSRPPLIPPEAPPVFVEEWRKCQTHSSLKGSIHPPLPCSGARTGGLGQAQDCGGGGVGGRVGWSGVEGVRHTPLVWRSACLVCCTVRGWTVCTHVLHLSCTAILLGVQDTLINRMRKNRIIL